MRTFVTALLGCLIASGSLLAQVPIITSVQNPASNILPGLPNFGIPQGSIFVLYGSGLGPSTIAIAPTLPYSNQLAGTSITITAGGLTFNPYMIYALSTQVAAVMPSTAPTGSATIKVTTFGLTGQAFTTTIVQNNFGISTLNQTGFGPAVITYPTSTTPFYGIVSSTNSAIPNTTYTMWGTGLGPATGGNSDDNANVFAAVGPQVQVLVGGISAAVTYYGRSPGAGPGLDQINFTIPAGLSGCNVSLVVLTASTLSNNTTIPISSGGGPCSEPVGVSAATWPPLLAMSGGINLSYFKMSQTASTTYSNGTPTTTTAAQTDVSFVHYTQSQLASQYLSIFSPNASFGSCVTTITLAQTSNSGSSTPNYTYLDAGANVSYTTFAGGFVPLGKQPAGYYQVTGNAPYPAGTYTFADGTGGAGVGAIGSVALTVPQYATWTNQTALATNPITRANGVTVTWSGGTSSSQTFIDIIGSAGFGNGAANTISFECTSPLSAGTFTIPAAVLTAFPPGPGSLQVGESVGQPLTVPGMNLSAGATINIASASVNWN